MKKISLLLFFSLLALANLAGQDKTLAVTTTATGRQFTDPVVEIETKTAKTTSGQSAWLNIEDYSAAGFVLDANACTGTTPTLDVLVEHSTDKAIIFSATGGGFTQVTTVASTQLRTVKDLMRFVRVSWTIAGTTPSCTFGVKVNVLSRGV
jgi:hypothetical protein